MKRELSYERLNMEYLSWSLENHDEPNVDGKYFGEFMYGKYDIDKEYVIVVDYEEVYSGLLNELYKKVKYE